MDDLFDKKLNNHIRDVFEQYEHPGDADAGWAQLRQRFPAQQRRRPAAWLWWSSAAAILLVVAGLGFWLTGNNNTANTVAQNKPVKTQQVQRDTTTADKLDNPIEADQQAVAKNAPLNSTKPQPIDPFLHNKYNTVVQQPVYANVLPVQTNTPTAIKQTVVPIGAMQTPEIQANGVNANGVAATVIAQNTAAAKAPSDSVSVMPSKIPSGQIADGQQTIIAANTNNRSSQDVKPKQRSIIELLEADKVNNPVAKADKEKQNRDKKVNFSVYAATYFNYAEGSTNQVNAGAGFTSDIKLTGKLKLSTGMALAQNSLKYNSGLPENSNARGAMYSAAPVSDPVLRPDGLFAANAAVPVFRNYNASLIGLDVPINLKYEFNPEKSDTYVSAGLSSGTFIGEKYTYNYAYSNSRSAETQSAVSTNSFNGFYFGRTLNFSFGVGYPLGKSNSLIIEPFVKYPLEGMGAQNLRFGASGLNLKIRFKKSRQ
ncbi:hypothetical protein FPZ43_13460 [Mucilaginibacter pallidiroseus]|uniref:Outer membrane protein beta-barrel domain-containing protein n=1 Tax=Mucilaginibacter pallidiroseus TaxID=2599295 RepID=A0A563U822_9SPHI|nr:hypothetical protein [Mucilaginibacter pallidiroseus]TWR27478.1 hypothetical protein FPZ43_13460 [Mucilaginibacter pallidiroseus]